MLRVFQPSVMDVPKRVKKPKQNTKKWLVNGFPATIAIWTAEEWNRLSVKPNDAQVCDNGVRVALRID